MKGYTKIPNGMLNQSQLPIEARYLYCLLLRYCGNDEWCFPSQKTLSKDMSLSDRHIRNILGELIMSGIIERKRRGWNRSNTYHVAKNLKAERKGISYHLGNLFPFHVGNSIPPNRTYLKGKGKRSLKGLEKMKKDLIRRGILKDLHPKQPSSNIRL